MARRVDDSTVRHLRTPPEYPRLNVVKLYAIPGSRFAADGAYATGCAPQLFLLLLREESASVQFWQL